MPYIKQEDRKRFEDFLSYAEAYNPGELNYVITMLCKDYLDRKGVSYQTHNDIIGVLECAKQEWYRRNVAPYEDKKILENGDV